MTLGSHLESLGGRSEMQFLNGFSHLPGEKGREDVFQGIDDVNDVSGCGSAEEDLLIRSTRIMRKLFKLFPLLHSPDANEVILESPEVIDGDVIRAWHRLVRQDQQFAVFFQQSVFQELIIQRCIPLQCRHRKC